MFIWLNYHFFSPSSYFLSTEPRVTNARSILLQDDGVGIQVDVRDIVIEVPKGQIGISAKYNHAAIKHSRLSDKIDFGKEWTDHPCGEKYFKTVEPVFMQLREMRAQNMLFRDIQGKETRIYLPVLTAFEDELKRLCESFRGVFVEKFFRYLLGRHDFYKTVLKTPCKRKTISLQSINIGCTLEYCSKWKIPERIRVIERKSG